jgi:hypothetical protein
VVKLLVLLSLLSLTTYAKNDDYISKVSIEMNIIPASKAIVQWERVFSSEKRKARYHIDQLSPDVQVLLKTYLIQHAADSSQPMVPGL